jgi:DNA-binding CsgD family transcriptional regulator
MDGIEFFIVDGDLMYRNAEGICEVVDESKHELVKVFLDRIKDFYPAAYKALQKEYRKSALNVPYYQFLIVRRFCKCNFGNLDTTEIDVDDCRWSFEKVQCPRRGECPLEGTVCNPQFDSRLSEAELRVMRLLYEGSSYEEIAGTLYISVNTVKYHVKGAYLRLGIHTKAEFIRYANQNTLFK